MSRGNERIELALRTYIRIDRLRLMEWEAEAARLLQILTDGGELASDPGLGTIIRHKLKLYINKHPMKDVEVYEYVWMILDDVWSMRVYQRDSFDCSYLLVIFDPAWFTEVGHACSYREGTMEQMTMAELEARKLALEIRVADAKAEVERLRERLILGLSGGRILDPDEPEPAMGSVVVIGNHPWVRLNQEETPWVILREGGEPERLRWTDLRERRGEGKIYLIHEAK